MALNNSAVAAALQTLLEGLGSLDTVQIGVPANPTNRVSAYITIGGQQWNRKLTGITQRLSRFFVLFAYRLDGNETLAETTLMAAVDGFLVALAADLTLAGTVVDLTADSAAADEPSYQQRLGKEYREYPVIVETTQRGTYEVNP